MTRPASSRRTAILVWLAALAACVFVIARTSFTADLSAFLPQAPTREQQVLLDQLRDGMVSRLILIGIEGSDAQTRATLSKQIAQRLRKDPAFVTVSNGEPVNAQRDQAFLFDHRYLLSPGVTPQRFTVQGLHDAIGDTIDLLASPAGLLVKPLLPRDPTGEFMHLLEQINGGNHPQLLHGAWVSRDGARAVLVAQTRAAGGDTDGQQRAIAQIRAAFDTARQQAGAQAAPARIVMTGPGVFSVQSRDTIEHEVSRLSILSTAIIVGLLLLVYRSFVALALGLLPVLSGALAGLVAVSLGFGMVHGITLGFGITLIGEAVDYSIYLFVQSRDAGAMRGDWISRFWPTIRLGVLTSIAGFSALLWSSFPGLAQLGLYSTAGLLAAAAVTRFILPHLLPDSFRIRDVSPFGNRIAAAAAGAHLLRWPVVIAMAAGIVVLASHHDRLWNTELSSLSPVPQAAQATDARLRADMGAPDVRYMIAVSGGSLDAVLDAAGSIARQLQPLVERGVLGGFETPSRYLPSAATQRARQASLPPPQLLEERLTQAVAGLPVRTGLFAPFIADVGAARERPLLQRKDLDGTSLAIAVDSMTFARNGRWHALLPLTAPGAGAAIAVAPVRAALAAAGQPDALFVDLKAESDHLYGGYLNEAITLSLAGLLVICVLLLAATRSPAQVARILLPLAAAVIVVAAGLALAGERMTILHLIGLLLIVAVGSNYALFFNRAAGHADNAETISPQTLASLVFANMTTVAGFGVLALSQVPVLHAIGITVGPGAVLALLFSAVFAARRTGAA